MSPPCRFCGSTDVKLTKEHLWPEWVGKLLPQTERATHTVLNRTAESEDTRSFEATPFTLRTKLVCRPCNSGWMSQVENRMKDVASGMILGRGRELHPGGLTAMATWATVKAFVFHSLHPRVQQLVPDHHYADLYSLKTQPPEYMHIYVARYGGSLWPGFYDHRGLGPEGSNEYAVYSATISLGHLALNVIGPLGEPFDTVDRPALDKGVRQIWPEPESFRFPFGLNLSERGLAELAGPPAPRPS